MRAEQARPPSSRRISPSPKAPVRRLRRPSSTGGSPVEHVALARRQLATFQSQVAPLEAQIDASRNAIAVLLGTYPEDLAKELAKPGPIPSPLAVDPATGGPVDLLRRRPDIAEDERRRGATRVLALRGCAIVPRRILDRGGRRPRRNSFVVYRRRRELDCLDRGPGAYWPLLDFGALDAQIEMADPRRANN